MSEPAPNGPAAETVGETGAPSAGPRRIEHREVEPIDLIDTAGVSVVKRLAPLAIVVVLLVLLLRRRRRS